MIFAQIFDLLHREQFQRCVNRYGGDKRVRSFSCRDQFLGMAFGQLTRRESLSDIVTCLQAHAHKLFFMGIRANVAKSTLADANEKRDWRIYAQLAQVLIRKARDLYRDEELDFQLQDTVYALDATTIDLCLNLFPWAHFRNEHSPQQAAGYLTLAIQGPLTRASTALIPLSVFLVRAHSAPPWPNLLSPPLFQRCSHPTNIVLPIAPFFPIVLAVTLLALLCSFISARSSRALVLHALRIASVRDPYRIPIPPSRSHIVPLSLLSSPPTPSVLSFLSMPSDILPASLRDNVSPTHNAILALIRLFPPSLPSSFLKKSATP